MTARDLKACDPGTLRSLAVELDKRAARHIGACIAGKCSASFADCGVPDELRRIATDFRRKATRLDAMREHKEDSNA